MSKKKRATEFTTEEAAKELFPKPIVEMAKNVAHEKAAPKKSHRR